MHDDERQPLGVVVVAAVVVVLAALHAAAAVVVPLALSFLVTVLAAPVQQRLLRKGWTRAAAFLTVLVPTLALLAAVFWALDLSLSAFVADLPSYRPGGEQLLTDLLSFGKVVGVDLTHLVRVGRVIGAAIREADVATKGILSSVAGSTVVLLLTGFMLYEALDYPEKAREIVGEGRQLDRLVGFTDDLSRFIAILTIGAALTAAGDFAILLALGIPSALLWASLAFLLSYVPNIGGVMVVVPPTIATLVRFGFGRALLVLALMTFVDNFVGIVVVPRLIGRRLAIAPFWGMASVVFWAWLLGPVGAILAIPLTLAAKFILESGPATRPLGRLLEPLRRGS